MNQLTLLCFNEHCNRFIFTTPVIDRSAKLLKVEPYSDKLSKEDIIRNHVMENGHKVSTDFRNRFVFWSHFNPRAKITKESLKENVQNVKLEHDMYQVLTTEYLGTDCERLLKSDFKCPNCMSYLSDMKIEGYTIDSKHSLIFLHYLIQSVDILSKLGIHHNDLRLANIVVHPTDEEAKTGVISQSLPKIIDFGLSDLVTSEQAAKNNFRDIINLFSTCKHGMMRLPEEISNWLTQSVIYNEAIKDVLTAFNNLSSYQDLTIQSLLDFLVTKFNQFTVDK